MPDSTVDVLLVANGNYQQETFITNHLAGFGAYTVTKMKDYQVKSTTDLSPYDLVIITGFAPNISSSGLNRIKASGKPILVVSYWNFDYAHRLGLTTSGTYDYAGAKNIELPAALNDYVRYAGQTPAVYTTTYTMYGVPEWSLADDVIPLAYGTSGYIECTVIADPARKIIATGVYDTKRYTTYGWRLFDLMLNALKPVGPIWASQAELLQGFGESGLAEYLDGLTGSEPAAEVLANVWRTMHNWNLYALGGYIHGRLIGSNPAYGVWPPYVAPTILKPHPEFNDPPYDGGGYGDDQKPKWFLGQHSNGSQTIPDHGDYITGTDLGISVKTPAGTYFYMGDTIPAGVNGQAAWTSYISFGPIASPFAPVPFAGEFDKTGCAPGAECNDAIVMMAPSESTPENGVDLLPGVGSTGKVRVVTIEGVHRDYGPILWDTGAHTDMRFNVPTGGMAFDVSWPIIWLDPDYNVHEMTLDMPATQLWYTTHSMSEETLGGSAKSWVGCSWNGTDFDNCYPAEDYSNTYFSKSKFINVSPVEVGAEDLAAMGANAPSSPSGRGFLLYGSGGPSWCGPMYLAYVDAADFGILDPFNRPVGVQYYDQYRNSPWTTDEDLATPITAGFLGCLKNKSQFEGATSPGEWNNFQTVSFAVAYQDTLHKLGAAIATGQIDLANIGLSDTPENRRTVSLVLASLFLRDYDDNLHYGYPEWSVFGEISVKYHKPSGRIVMLSNHRYDQDAATGSMLDALGASDGDPMIDVVGSEQITSLLDSLPDNPFAPSAEPWWAIARLWLEYYPWLQFEYNLLDQFNIQQFDWDNVRVHGRVAPIERPWDMSSITDSDATPTNQAGYGPYIIDDFTNVVDVSGEKRLRLWHTLSMWGGGALPGPYGVYTTYTEIPCSKLGSADCGE